MSNPELGSVILLYGTEPDPRGVARRFEVATDHEAVTGRIVAGHDTEQPWNTVHYMRGGESEQEQVVVPPGVGLQHLQDYNWAIGAIADVLGLHRNIL